MYCQLTFHSYVIGIKLQVRQNRCMLLETRGLVVLGQSGWMRYHAVKKPAHFWSVLMMTGESMTVHTQKMSPSDVVRSFHFPPSSFTCSIKSSFKHDFYLFIPWTWNCVFSLLLRPNPQQKQPVNGRHWMISSVGARRNEYQAH